MVLTPSVTVNLGFWSAFSTTNRNGPDHLEGARLWVDDLDASRSAALRPLVSAEPDPRFAFDAIKLAAIGDFLAIADRPRSVRRRSGRCAMRN